MKRVFCFLFLIVLFGLSPIRADENMQAAQSRLKQAGFYFGKETGVYDDETAAALTRYQIRHGLAISGKLDSATAQSLGVPAEPERAEPFPASGSWRRLRNGDMQFLQKLNAGSIPAPRPPVSPPPRVSSVPSTQNAALDPHGPPPRLAEETQPAGGPQQADTTQRAASPPQSDYGAERLRDYVGAFVLAGLDPKVGAELEFFADRVNYFGEPNVGREKIQRDLLRYDRKWPERRFWLAGSPSTETQSGGQLKVTFPLRYELRSHSRRVSGEVVKTLTLRKTGDRDLQIIAVNEAKSGHRVGQKTE